MSFTDQGYALWETTLEPTQTRKESHTGERGRKRERGREGERERGRGREREVISL